MYLLAYDPRRRRPVTGYRLGYALRAAALTDLWLTGQLTDVDGRPRPAIRATATATDPVLAAVLAQVAAGRPQSWQRWIQRTDRGIGPAVRDQLAAGGWIRAERRRILGVFPVDRITIRDPLLAGRLSAAVAEALRPGRLPDRLDRRDAALVALAAAGEARAALPRRQAREHATRLAQLADLAGPAVPALRKAVQHARATSAG
jgi:hypothetical protein